MSCVRPRVGVVASSVRPTNRRCGTTIDRTRGRLPNCRVEPTPGGHGPEAEQDVLWMASGISPPVVGDFDVVSVRFLRPIPAAASPRFQLAPEPRDSRRRYHGICQYRVRLHICFIRVYKKYHFRYITRIGFGDLGEQQPVRIGRSVGCRPGRFAFRSARRGRRRSATRVRITDIWL